MRSYYDLKRWPIMNWLPWSKEKPNRTPHDDSVSEFKISRALPRCFFKTKRLKFRPLAPDDLHNVLKIVSNPEVVRYVDDGQPMDEDLVSRWISHSRRVIAEHGSGTGAIVLRSSNRIIGWGGLSRPKNEPPEIVYGFDKSYWKKGYGLEIAAGLTRWCEKDLTLDEVRATVYPENTGSIRILEKLGFDYVDDLPNDDGTACRLYIRKR